MCSDNDMNAIEHITSKNRFFPHKKNSLKHVTRADCKLNLVHSLNTNGFFVSSQQLYLRAALVLFCFSWNDTWLPIPTDHLMAFNCCSSPVDLVRVTWKKKESSAVFWRCSRFAKFEFTPVTSWINCMYRQESVKKFLQLLLRND